ncbi:MAG: hypothetical protein KDN22_09905 [Verrucomicrobiae bacterium]|nr:hypothetical protein [Verrucomicrobiae bacterium]
MSGQKSEERSRYFWRKEFARLAIEWVSSDRKTALPSATQPVSAVARDPYG